MPKETLIYNNSNNNQSKNFIKKIIILSIIITIIIYMIITILYLKENNIIKHIIQTIVTKFNVAIMNK